MRILFQGDSITDCERDRADGSSLGNGYAQKVSQYLATFMAEKNIEVLNRGVSGDTAAMLLERWQADALDLKPDVLSLLIGINDTWRRYDSDSPTSAEAFRQSVWALLDSTKKALPDAKLVLIEPFLLHVVPEWKQETWREDLHPKQIIIRDAACAFGAALVAADGLFAEVCTQKPAAHWLGDGVHPTDAGHALLAEAWLGKMRPMLEAN